jgi:hypothetical protein
LQTLPVFYYIALQRCTLPELALPGSTSYNTCFAQILVPAFGLYWLQVNLQPLPCKQGTSQSATLAVILKTNFTKMKNIIILILVQLSLLSCAQNEKLGYKKLDLENFDFNKKIEDYFSEDKFLQKETYEIDYDSTNIVTTYMTIGDSLSVFDKTYFNGISIMKDKRDKLMALTTFFKHDNDIRPLKDFIASLNNKYGNPAIIKRKSLNSEYTSCYWQLEDRMIIVNSTYNTELYQKKDENSLQDNVEFETELFIVKKESQNEIIGKIHNGEWMNLDSPTGADM